MQTERKLVVVIEPSNPYLVSIKDLVGLEQFIQIFSYKTMLDIIGDAVELHFNNELNEENLSDSIEELLLSFRSPSLNISFSYMPFFQLVVTDSKYNHLLRFNLSQFVHLLYWQVQRLIVDYVITPLNLKPGERVFIENTMSSLSSLQFIIRIANEYNLGHYHVNPIANASFY